MPRVVLRASETDGEQRRTGGCRTRRSRRRRLRSNIDARPPSLGRLLLRSSSSRCAPGAPRRGSRRARRWSFNRRLAVRHPPSDSVPGPGGMRTPCERSPRLRTDRGSHPSRRRADESEHSPRRSRKRGRARPPRSVPRPSRSIGPDETSIHGTVFGRSPREHPFDRSVLPTSSISYWSRIPRLES